MIRWQLVKSGLKYVWSLFIILSLWASLSPVKTLAQDEVISAEVVLVPSEPGAVPAFEFSSDNLPPAPTGFQYALWSMPAEAIPMRLDVLDKNVEPYRIDALDDISFALTEGFQFALSIDKADDASPAEPYHVVSVAALPSGLASALSVVLSDGPGSPGGSLQNALTQTGIAQQHTGFIQDSINDGSIIMARTHAEHVVNTLDGETGMFFGDLNRDGQAQNPGDGYGVRVYLADALSALNDLSDDADLSDDEREIINQMNESLSGAQSLVADAREQATKLYAIDTLDEAGVVHDDLADILDELASVIQDSIAAAYSLIHFTINIDPAALTPPIEMHEMGDLRLLSVMNTDGALDFQGFSFILTELPDVLVEVPLDVWAMQADAEPVLLHTVEVDEADDPYSEPIDNSISNLPAQIGLSLAAVEGGSIAPGPEQLVMESELSPAVANITSLLLEDDGSNGAGSLQLAAQQTDIALAHTGFIMDSIDEDDLMLARNHAEHTVNILDGEGGMLYGDLNRDGQTQNPGDGYGVRAYLQDTVDALSGVSDDATLDDEQKQTVEEIQQTLDDALTDVSEAQELAIKLYAIDTNDEAMSVHDELESKLDDLIGAIQHAGERTVSLAVYRLMADPANFTVVDQEIITTDQPVETGQDTAPSDESVATDTTKPIEPNATESTDFTDTAESIIPSDVVAGDEFADSSDADVDQPKEAEQENYGVRTSTPPPPDAEPGDSWTNAVTGSTFVFVAGDTFEMGSDADVASSRGARA